MELQGKLAVVTGAGIRLGRALSEGLAEEGMRLALHYMQHEKEARDLADRIRASRPGQEIPQADCFQADLGHPASISRLSEQVETRMGAVDVLVLSAAVYPRAPLDEITPESMESTLRVNLSSPFLLARDFGLRMKRRGGGAIVVLLDWSMDRPYRNRLPYTMAKAGLRAGVFGLARALAPEVRVNAVSPGAVLLPEATEESYRERVLAATPLGRIGTPEDVVSAAVFLLKSEFVTGTIVTVDGGRSTV